MEDIKQPKTHINFGILTAVICMVIFVLYYVLGLKTTGFTGFIPSLIFMILIIIAVVNHSKALEGNTTFGNLFGTGFKTSAVVAVLMVLFIIIILLVVPGYKEHVLALSREGMEKKNTMTSDQIDTAMKFVDRTFTVFAIGGTILAYLILGCIASLVGAAVAKKNPSPQQQAL